MDNSNQILDNESERYCEIYKLTNIKTNKCYIGKAVSHILNHNRYRPYGAFGRFKCHVSEAYSNKKKQCTYLNSSIRKYGKEQFQVSIVEKCGTNVADEREMFHIEKHKTLYPHGYNLLYGGKSSPCTDDIKKKVSNGVKKFYESKKFERFSTVRYIHEPISQYIRPLNRDGKQYGWYVFIENKKADFGGVHITLEESRENAEKFINELKNMLATYLDDRETP